ncbi:MAG: tyrosine decarboxylase MfnA [Methanobacteriota archaeon]
MDEKGLEEGKFLDILSNARKKDLKYSDGKILSSMCTLPHPFARKVYELFAETNLGDAGLFEGTKELEDEAVKLLGSLLGNEDAKGFIVSGGTEANIMALWAARNKAGKKNAEVIVPESAHFSFEKAANLLGLRLVTASLDSRHCISVGDVEKKLDKNTIAIVGVAGSTEYGAIDNIEALAEIAVKNDLHLHVDAAFGGFVIPFLIGYAARKFDFSIPGVSSITIDPHKMGLAPIPSGGILFRSADFLKFIETRSPYLTERRQFTLSGTRSGASAASVYAVLKLLGREGYRKNVENCMNLTMQLYREINALGLRVLKPAMNILVFSHEKQDAISEKLLEKGWIVSRTRKGEIRLVIMPHVTEKSIARFVEDLESICTLHLFK